jgi:hypothetical protein
MRGRTVLFVVLAVVMALGGVYVGWSTSSPKAAADAPATPPSSRGPAQEAGSTRSRSPAGHVPKAPPPKGSQQQGNPPKGNPPKGNPQPGDTPAPPPNSPPRPTGPVRFAQVTTTPSDDTLDTLISDDRRAFATTFSEFEVVIGPASAEPSATKSFSMTLPLTDGAKGEKLKIYASGWASTTAGATAQLTLRAGRRTIVRSFPSGSDDEYVEILELPATPGTTYQLSAVIEIHKDAAGGGDGFINAVSIESGIS